MDRKASIYKHSEIEICIQCAKLNPLGLGTEVHRRLEELRKGTFCTVLCGLFDLQTVSSTCQIGLEVTQETYRIVLGLIQIVGCRYRSLIHLFTQLIHVRSSFFRRSPHFGIAIRHISHASHDGNAFIARG